MNERPGRAAFVLSAGETPSCIPRLANRPESSISRTMNEPTGQSSSGSARILVVDDDALVAMSMVSLLEDLGHSVVEATSGAQALAIIQGDAAIDLVITDQSMPGMSGTELARAVFLLRPSLPVMLATGYREVPEGSELRLPQLMKPYDDEA